MLEDIFQKINLNKEQLDIYVALFENGPGKVSDLYKRLKIPRSSFYGLLDGLLKQGLISQSEKLGVKIWQAEDPEKIKEIFEDKINDYEQIKNSLDNILPEIINRKKIDYKAPHFKYFEGKEEVKYILKNMLLYKNIETFTLWPIKNAIEVLGKDFFIEHNKKRIRRDIYVKSIWPQDKVVDLRQNIFLGVGDKFKREIRLAPKNITYSMGYWIYGNKAAFLSSQKEMFGFIIESIELVELLRVQFDLLWNLSTKFQDNLFEKDVLRFLEE